MNPQLSDSKVDVVSDSTAELIRLGETTSDRVPSTAGERTETRNQLPDSTSDMSARSPMTTAGSRQGRRLYSDDAVGGGIKGRRPLQDNGKAASRDASHTQRSESAGIR